MKIISKKRNKSLFDYRVGNWGVLLIIMLFIVQGVFFTGNVELNRFKDAPKSRVITDLEELYPQEFQNQTETVQDAITEEEYSAAEVAISIGYNMISGLEVSVGVEEAPTGESGVNESLISVSGLVSVSSRCTVELWNDNKQNTNVTKKQRVITNSLGLCNLTTMSAHVKDLDFSKDDLSIQTNVRHWFLTIKDTNPKLIDNGTEEVSRPMGWLESFNLTIGDTRYSSLLHPVFAAGWEVSTSISGRSCEIFHKKENPKELVGGGAAVEWEHDPPVHWEPEFKLYGVAAVIGVSYFDQEFLEDRQYGDDDAQAVIDFLKDTGIWEIYYMVNHNDSDDIDNDDMTGTLDLVNETIGDPPKVEYCFWYISTHGHEDGKLASSNTNRLWWPPYTWCNNYVTEGDLCERVEHITEKSSQVYLFYWMVSCQGEGMNDLWENADYHNWRALFWRYQPAMSGLGFGSRELPTIKEHSKYANKSCQWMFGPIPPNSTTYKWPEGCSDVSVNFVEFSYEENQYVKNEDPDADIKQYNTSDHEFCFVPNTAGWVPTCRTRGEPSEYRYQPNTWESEDHDYMMEAYETGNTYQRYVGFYTRVDLPQDASGGDRIYIEFDGRAKSDTSGSTVTNLYVSIYSEDWQTRIGESWSVVSGGVGIDSGWLIGENHTFENIPKGFYYNVFIYYNDAWSANWHQHIYIKNIYLGNVEPVRVPPAKHEYLFNTGYGITVYDNVGSLDGITGADWSSESFNDAAYACLNFDGSIHSYVNLYDNPDWSFTSGVKFSISAWIEPDWPTSDRKTILSKYALSSNKEYILQVYDGRINFKVFDDAGDNYIGAKSNANTISANTWYHVVVTYNGGTSPSDIKIYINCFESSNDLSSGSYSGMSDTNATLYIGRRQDTSNYGFDGKIDNVRFFNEELSASEVLLLYDIDAPLDPDPLDILTTSYIGFDETDWSCLSSLRINFYAAGTYYIKVEYRVDLGSWINVRWSSAYYSTGIHVIWDYNFYYGEENERVDVRWSVYDSTGTTLIEQYSEYIILSS